MTIHLKEDHFSDRLSDYKIKILKELIDEERTKAIEKQNASNLDELEENEAKI